MKKIFSRGFGLMLVALLFAPAFLAAAEAEPPVVASAKEGFKLATARQTSLATEEPGFATMPPGGCIICHEECFCSTLQTPPTTRVGATCLRARQNAAAAARALAVCPSNSSGSCGSTTHTVAPCQALPTGGYSATAVATYKCLFCEEVCIDICP